MTKRFVVPSYRLHKGSGEAFVQIHGRRFYLGVYGSEKSQEAYQRILAERLAARLPSTTEPGHKPESPVLLRRTALRG